MMNVAVDTLGGRLRAARMIRGLDQDEIGALVGASRPTVSKWERDKTEPTVSQLILWSRATQQPVEAILDGLSVVHPLGLEPRTHWLRVRRILTVALVGFLLVGAAAPNRTIRSLD
jgi:transcriptional regulator with XRE-family HTH domain